MTSALLTCSAAPGGPELSADLESVGIHVVGIAERGTLVREAIRSAPDLVVCYESHPDDALFASTATLRSTAPRPVVVFTTDSDADKIEQAAKSGIHAYVINGYGLHRLRSVIHVAQARFRNDQLLREELSDIHHRFDERKLVDRAKGILMRARQISEDEAFRVLRTAAMHGKQRVGQVSRQVIDTARFAEAVNVSGQLRMLSQRLVKLYALLCAGVTPVATKGLFDDSLKRADLNLTLLARSLSKPTFGDLLDKVHAPWSALRSALQLPVELQRLSEVDLLAERLLVRAEQLTANLEAAGLATTLRVINIAGRQRMLSQRMAKQALIAGLLREGSGTDAQASAKAAQSDFVQALDYLQAIPLGTEETRKDLQSAHVAWNSLKEGLVRFDSDLGRNEIAHSSELLLALFDRLTEHYERSMQVLMG